ncbi:bacterial transcriptional activator domain-containing protein [Actinoplanes sp. TRM 88003]|uniref:Bacterial transcriptional activator domain-containing protein n=1 Tax=Paractinoplanes aksuensis TaxID=2939490 RepID=A0ABT1DXJ7_9ACTN|nr:bacterial transcriptional activator domain-containing protein [Actinoplanes aksuensis]MCO8275581.1 bacterial transcriptional activator domain-containing protein [Actinoplanes aksuensis]
MHGIRVRAFLLGDVRVIVNGRLVETSSRHGRDLVVYLLLHPDAPVPRDVLIDTFWPRARPTAGRSRLHVLLAGVRKTLRAAAAEPVVERCGEAYRIARDRPYAEWAAPRRAALHALAVEAQSRLVLLCTGRGEHGAAATLARRILAEDPCNEDVHRALMLCYARTGLRHLALLQYRQLVTTLWADLRVRPAAETTDLYERLRRPERMPQIAADPDASPLRGFPYATFLAIIR